MLPPQGVSKPTPVLNFNVDPKADLGLGNLFKATPAVKDINAVGERAMKGDGIAFEAMVNLAYHQDETVKKTVGEWLQKLYAVFPKQTGELCSQVMQSCDPNFNAEWKLSKVADMYPAPTLAIIVARHNRHGVSSERELFSRADMILRGRFTILPQETGYDLNRAIMLPELNTQVRRYENSPVRYAGAHYLVYNELENPEGKLALLLLEHSRRPQPATTVFSVIDPTNLVHLTVILRGDTASILNPMPPIDPNTGKPDLNNRTDFIEGLATAIGAFIDPLKQAKICREISYNTDDLRLSPKDLEEIERLGGFKSVDSQGKTKDWLKSSSGLIPLLMHGLLSDEINKHPAPGAGDLANKMCERFKALSATDKARECTTLRLRLMEDQYLSLMPNPGLNQG